MKKKLSTTVAVALLAGPMAANAVQIFDFTGTCPGPGGCAITSGNPNPSSTATGVLTLSDSYVFGTAMTIADVLSFTYHGGDGHMNGTYGVDAPLQLEQISGGLFADGNVFGGTFSISALNPLGFSFGISDNSWRLLHSPWINTGTDYSMTLRSVSVTEPGALVLFGLGLVGLGFARRRRVTN